MAADTGLNSQFFKGIGVPLPYLAGAVDRMAVEIALDAAADRRPGVAVLGDEGGVNPVILARVDAPEHVRVHHGLVPVVDIAHRRVVRL